MVRDIAPESSLNVMVRTARNVPTRERPDQSGAAFLACIG